MARYADVENVDELIDGMYLLLKDCQLKRRSGCLADNCKDCMKRFFTYTHILPTADVVEVKHGKWIDKYGNKYDNHLYICSVCGHSASYKFEIDELGHEKVIQDLTLGCPYCLAKMDLEE